MSIRWQRITPVDETLPDVYCMSTIQSEWDEATLWHTYVRLAEREAVFRSLTFSLVCAPSIITGPIESVHIYSFP